ncbi:universal stress protein [Leptolyngbya ohadii]|uniref:universal stress protein n=1 Tax=Leptolyngbya ohadii TaxID=1962290 RepID=UPI000B59F0A6|nr:universal stress protein [Leptolyngbya ohadii]
MGFKRILVAIDYSLLSQTVFDQALDLARQSEAKLLLFHCMTADVVTLMPPMPGEMGISPEIMHHSYQVESLRLSQQTHQVQELLYRYCQLARQAGVSATSEYRIAEPGEGLCQAAKTWGADLIVMGRRGRSGLAEVFLGSVSNHVMHRAPCAVLVVQKDCGRSIQDEAVEPQTLSEPAVKS